MKNARPQNAETSVRKQGHFTPAKQFTGTNNPRHLRVLQALLTRPVPRESVDKVAGCSNGPDLIATLRRRGLEIPCERIKSSDCDGKRCCIGVYYLKVMDRRLISQWLSKRERQS